MMNNTYEGTSYLVKIDAATWFAVYPADEHNAVEVQEITAKEAEERMDDGWGFTSNLQNFSVIRDLEMWRLAQGAERIRIGERENSARRAA